MKSVVEAATLPLLKSETRAKLPGAFIPHLELGYQVTDIKEEIVRNYTSNGSSPNYYHSIYGKGGVGLPFGFHVEGGLSQSIYDHHITSVYASAGYQLLDLAGEIYFDLIPALSVTGTFMRTFNKPEVMAFTAQSCLGIYHRQTNMQMSYIFQYTYAVMSATEPYINKQFMRHGTALQIPFYQGLYVRNEIFFTTLSGAFSFGYQF